MKELPNDYVPGKMANIPYKYGDCSIEARKLIVGNTGDTNPLAESHTASRILPFHKLRIGESLYFHKTEMLKWKWKLAKETATRYNRQYTDMFRFVDHGNIFEIVRIR